MEKEDEPSILINWSGFSDMLHGLVINWSGFVVFSLRLMMLGEVDKETLGLASGVLLIWVDMYDASTKDNFNLRVVVLWTINDYPALGTLCGCPYNGFKGCVVCGKDTNCVRLSASSKQSYVGHKRYLPYNHPLRKQKKAFNRQQEFLQAPIPMTGEQIYNEVKHIENKWEIGKRTNNNASENQEDTRGRGGKIQKQKRNTTEEEEKNVAESIVGALLHVPGKTKDGLNAQLDLAELGVKPELFAMQDEDKSYDKYVGCMEVLLDNPN
ncbi:retrovirus-related pol polyprotein from transposon TNT 1-94 [Tanacetum coccineum]